MGGRSSPCRGQIRIRTPISKLDRIQIRIRITNLGVMDLDAPSIKYSIYCSNLGIFLSMTDYHWLLYKYEYSAHCTKCTKCTYRETLTFLSNCRFLLSSKRIRSRTWNQCILNPNLVPKWHFKSGLSGQLDALHCMWIVDCPCAHLLNWPQLLQFAFNYLGEFASV